MASSNNFDSPHLFPPPPPTHPFRLPPPPPDVRPPPSPVPPAPSPSNNTTVIVVVFVSLGGVFFLAFLAVGLCCLLKKRKKKEVKETDVIHVDEHMKVKEAIVEGPHGPQVVMLDIEDDVHVDEVINKEEKFGKGLRTKSAEGNSSSALHEGAPSSSSSSSDHPQLQHRA